MSYPSADVRAFALSLSNLNMGWERYRAALAAQLDVTTSELIALGLIARGERVTPSDLADQMNLTSGSVTALLGRLEEAGFIARTPNPDDKRSVIVTARPSGQHAMGWMRDCVEADLRTALATVPTADLSALGHLAEAVGAQMSEAAAVPKPV